MNKRIMNVFAVIFILVSIVLSVICYFVTKPMISLDRQIDDKIVTALQVKEMIFETIEEIKTISKYDLIIGEIFMTLDKNQRGDVQVTLVEKDKNNRSRVIIAELDTKNHIFDSICNYGKEKKLYPGEVNFDDWNVDSDDAIEIAEKYYANIVEFRYEIVLKTCSYYKGTEETWDVGLWDKQNSVRYDVRIDPYTSEILAHSINRFWQKGTYLFCQLLMAIKWKK